MFILAYFESNVLAYSGKKLIETKTFLSQIPTNFKNMSFINAILKKLEIALPKILITGSSTEYKLTEFMKKRFDIDYNPSNHEYYIFKNLVKVLICADLNRSKFDSAKFKKTCADIEGSLLEVVLIENLNPRPETLENDLSKTSRVFLASQLKRYLFIHFTSSGEEKQIEDIKRDVKNFNVLFDAIGIRSDSDKQKFVDDQIDILNKNTTYYSLLRNRIIFNFIRNYFFSLLLISTILIKFGFRLSLKLGFFIIYNFVCSIKCVFKKVYRLKRVKHLADTLVQMMDYYYFIIASKLLEYRIFQMLADFIRFTSLRQQALRRFKSFLTYMNSL